MKKIYSFLFSALIILVFNACQDFEVPKFQGEVKFSLDNVQFSNTAAPNARIESNSLWKHIYKSNAVLNLKHTASGNEYTLEYNPNEFGGFSRTLPYGAYTFESIVEGGLFENYLPYTIKGEFMLENESLEISLTATTEYGLISVKNQSVSEAQVTSGSTSKSLNLLDDNTYFYIYAKGSIQIELTITESETGTKITRDIDVIDSKHYNYIINLNKGNLNIIDLILNPFGYEEETITSLEGDTNTGSSKFIEENGTIKCPNTIPGEKGTVNGKTYESVDRALLIQRRDEGADLTCVCTTLVTDMSVIFNEKPFNQAIGNWDVSNVTNMRFMFNGSTFNQDISKWNVSKVTDMSGMFRDSNFNKPIGNWNVGNVLSMREMFQHGSFNQEIEEWDVKNVMNMDFMFHETLFNKPLNKWNVANVRTMISMFHSTPFNQPIDKWNVSNATKMRGMFYQTPFNQNISNWCVTNITSEPGDFATNSPLTTQNKPVWGTCPN